MCVAHHCKHFPVDILPRSTQKNRASFLKISFSLIVKKANIHFNPFNYAGLYQILNAALIHMMSQYSFSIKMSVTYSRSIR